MNGIETYRKLERPPADALKEIGGGRLKGFTDISPQWRIEALTEAFGLCGIGWKYTIDQLWAEDGASGERAAFARISLYVKDGEAWSEPIPGIGGSMFIENERTGPHTSDEAYKMATTDALSVACKAIGVAAAIYRGLWDGAKYREISDEDRMGDVRNRNGQYSPKVNPGKPAVKGDGTAKAMLKLKTRLMSCVESSVFSPEDRQDAAADYHPGGRNLFNSDGDLKYLQEIVDKWENKRKTREAAEAEALEAEQKRAKEQTEEELF